MARRPRRDEEETFILEEDDNDVDVNIRVERERERLPLSRNQIIDLIISLLRLLRN